jgi:hypothetical protein
MRLASQPEHATAFEVASGKPADAGGGPIGIFTYPAGRIVASQSILEHLIMEAFDVEAYQVSGGPVGFRKAGTTLKPSPLRVEIQQVKPCIPENAS